MRALITGIAGFAGSHLADWLLTREGLEVAGIVRPNSDVSNLAGSRTALTLFEADLLDADAVIEIITDWAPTHIYHLAAMASVAVSWQRPAETLQVNAICQLNVLSAALALPRDTRVLIVGSADEYGRVSPDELPVLETAPLQPASPYGLSKVTQDLMGQMYHHSHGLEVVRVRPFNHIGPRQRPGFVVPDFCQQIARIEAGQQQPTMRVGNLSARRDFTDVRDVVRAYWLALERGTAGQVYNICAGVSVSIQQILDQLLDASHASIAVELDPARMRPSDMPDLYGEATRLRADTGWHPEIALKQTLEDTLNSWRSNVAAAR